MTLPEFIEANVEAILLEWERFAESVWPAGAKTAPADLRDHAERILRAAADDIRRAQTDREQAQKSKGQGSSNEASGDLREASMAHGAGRFETGFELSAMVAEYRALRAAVLRLWSAGAHTTVRGDLEQVTRFHESIDESVAMAVRSFDEASVRAQAQLVAAERAARVQADAANRAKDVFLATLSHEMRTPLNAVAGWAAVLRLGPSSSAQLHEGLEAIERNTRAQVQLLEDLLDVSRIVSGKLRIDVHACSLVEVVSAGMDALRPAAAARGIRMRRHLDRTADEAVCDPIRMQQVVWNLVSNAVKFTPKGGQIDVTLRRVGSSVEIEVCDDGQGMAADLIPRVFERFHQADGSPSRRFTGLGLGLSIVRYIVEAHGGTVEASSAGTGKGSCFTMRLPICAVSPTATLQVDAPAAAATMSTPLKGVRVLVVDDDPDAREILRLVLQRAGATVTVSASARDALERLAYVQPMVLVSDLGMPERDGFELIRQVRLLGHTSTSLPAVALTAFVQPDDARSAVDAGFQLHLAKPVDPVKLTRAVCDLMEHRHDR